MTRRDSCPRCGLESNYSRRTWPDKHPAAAVTAGLVTLVFMGMMLSVHPVAAVMLLAVAAVVGAVVVAGRAQDRRDAMAARADYENRKWMESSIKWPALSPEAPRPSRRPADHWSPTEPMRIA
jgi:hypothetical protein